jgi:hypothetical protein
MSVFAYTIIFISIPIVLAIIYDINKKYKKSNAIKISKQKEKDSQWEYFISEKYNEMKIWDSNIEYEEVKKIVLDTVKKERRR